ncbi:hypothetical protein T484DRAFT_1911110, partial [Baffinella frigidus]
MSPVGSDTINNRKVSWERSVKDSNNVTQTEWASSSSSFFFFFFFFFLLLIIIIIIFFFFFVFFFFFFFFFFFLLLLLIIIIIIFFFFFFITLKMGIIGLYARQFASDYPDDVAALVLIDPLPSSAEEDAEIIKSYQQEALSPFMMQLCFRFLQPMGLFYTFFPFSDVIFTEKFKFTLQGGTEKPFNDLDILMAHIYQRQWCPSVLAEYEGLYDGDTPGIRTVAAADKKGYDMPTIIWVRDKARSISSSDPMFPASSEQIANAGRRSGDELFSPAAQTDQGFSRLADFAVAHGQRRVGEEHGQRRLGVCLEIVGVGGECLSWLDVQRQLLQASFRTPWIDPYTNLGDIKRGDKANCATNGCSEYAPMENPLEIYDSILDTWDTLGYQADLAVVLWHVKADKIVLEEGPTQADETPLASTTAQAARRAAQARLGGRGARLPTGFSESEFPEGAGSDADREEGGRRK